VILQTILAHIFKIKKSAETFKANAVISRHCSAHTLEHSMEA